jgi:hypothetical protein
MMINNYEFRITKIGEKIVQQEMSQRGEGDAGGNTVNACA